MYMYILFVKIINNVSKILQKHHNFSKIFLQCINITLKRFHNIILQPRNLLYMFCCDDYEQV